MIFLIMGLLATVLLAIAGSIIYCIVESIIKKRFKDMVAWVAVIGLMCSTYLVWG